MSKTQLARERVRLRNEIRQMQDELARAMFSAERMANVRARIVKLRDRLAALEGKEK